MRAPGSWLLPLGLPPFLYLATRLFAVLNAAALGVALPTFVLVSGAALAAFFLPDRATRPASIVYLAVGLSIIWVAVSPGSAGAVGFAFAAGGLAAGPIVALLSFAHPSEGVGTRLAGLEVALVDGLLLVAVLASLGAGPVAARAEVSGYFTVIGQQSLGLVAMLTQQGVVTAPVGVAYDGWYVSLAALPVLAVLWTVLLPVTGRGAPLPTGRRRAEGPSGAGVALPEPFRALLAARTAPRPAPLGNVPGLRAFAAAAGATLAYVAVAAVDPAYTLPFTSLGIVAAVVGLSVLLRRPIGPPAPGGADDLGVGGPSGARAGP